MRTLTTLAVFAIFNACCSAAVFQFNADQLLAAVSGASVSGLPFDDHRARGMWVVRFAMPWDSAGAKSSSAFSQVAHTVPQGITRFAEVLLGSADEVALADALLVAVLPQIRIFNGRSSRPTVPRGSLLSDRSIQSNVAFSGADDVVSLSAFVLENVPTAFINPLTYDITPSARVVSSRKELFAAIQAIDRDLVHAAVPAQVRQRASEIQHVLIVVADRDPKAKAVAFASAFTSGAMNECRGGTHVFIGTGAPFIELGAASANISARPVSLSADGSDLLFAIDAVRVSADEIAPFVFRIADSLETPAQRSAWVAGRILESRVGSTRFLAPFEADKPKAHALRRLDTAEQFVQNVAELKNGVAVVFFLRESDKFYAKHLKIAQQVAENAVTDFSANIPNQQGSTLRYDVFVIDVDAHRHVAHDLRVDKVPAVAVLLELRERTGKGLRFFKAKELEKASAITKWMRNDVFDGRDMVMVDPYQVKFSPETASKADNALLETDYFEINPRRFRFPASPDAVEAYTSAVEAFRDMTSPSATKKKAAETPEQQAKRSARETKEKEKAEKAKAKVLADLAAKEAAKKKKMEEKAAQEQAAAEKRKAEAAKRAAEEQEKRVREEADGTAARRRAAAKAKQARIERAAKLKKAKLASKVPRDRATVMKLWAEDSALAATKHIATSDDGSPSIIDRLL